MKNKYFKKSTNKINLQKRKNVIHKVTKKYKFYDYNDCYIYYFNSY